MTARKEYSDSNLKVRQCVITNSFPSLHCITTFHCWNYSVFGEGLGNQEHDVRVAEGRHVGDTGWFCLDVMHVIKSSTSVHTAHLLLWILVSFVLPVVPGMQVNYTQSLNIVSPLPLQLSYCSYLLFFPSI